MASNVQTLILNKTRPTALKTPELEPYFRLLENLLASLASASNSPAELDGSIGILEARFAELLEPESPNLTADCASLKVDSGYISVDIA